MSFKDYLKEIGNEMNVGDIVRRPTDEEYAIANEFIKGMNGKLSGIGIDKENGNIYVEIMLPSGGTEDFTLSPTGEVIEGI